MNDLISRQEAIDALKAKAVPLYKDPGCNDIWERDRTLDNAIDVIRGLPSAEPGWIPVEEKLPEVGESVLVTFSIIEKFSFVKIARYGTPIYEDKICFFENDIEWGDCEISGVTAWMPLPKPY